MTVINNLTAVDSDELKQINKTLIALTKAIEGIKIPDPAEEKLYKAREFDEYFSISRSKGQDARKKLIARGLIRPVEISPGVYRYRRSELLALNNNDLK